MREKLFTLTAKNFRWDYFRGSGKGGQKRNKTSSGVRCTHEESGAVGQSHDIPLWEKDAIVIYDDELYIHVLGGVHIISKCEVLSNPVDCFKAVLQDTEASHDLLYESFLQLAACWSLKCNYDELRKIRDEMK